MNDSWHEQRRKQHKIRLFGILIILLLVVVVVIRNNAEFLFKSLKFKPKVKSTTIIKKDTITVSKDSVDTINVDSSLKQDSLPKGTKQDTVIKTTSKKIISNVLSSIELAPVYCNVSNNKDINLNISLRIIFNSDSLEKEILLKREDFKVVLIRIVKEMSHSKIETTKLKLKLKKEFNKIVSKPVITDVEIVSMFPVVQSKDK